MSKDSLIRQTNDHLHELMDRSSKTEELKELIANLGSVLALIRAHDLFDTLPPAERALCHFAYAATTFDNNPDNEDQVYLMTEGILALSLIRS